MITRVDYYLQVRASNLDDIIKLGRASLKTLMEELERGQQSMVDLHDRRNVHGRREAERAQSVKKEKEAIK